MIEDIKPDLIVFISPNPVAPGEES